MKLNIKIFANMKEYYYTINNSNNEKEENEKNKSLISKLYNSVKKDMKLFKEKEEFLIVINLIQIDMVSIIDF